MCSIGWSHGDGNTLLMRKVRGEQPYWLKLTGRQCNSEKDLRMQTTTTLGSIPNR